MMGRILFVLVVCCTLCLWVNADCGGKDNGKEIVEVLMWSGGSWAGFMHGEYFAAPNYLGHDIDKKKWDCPVDCRFTGDKNRVGNVDAVIFEAQPITSYYDAYKWNPPQFPQKHTGQLWFNHGYETHYYFHIYGDKGYMDYIDANFTFFLHSQVPITFTCNWGGGEFEDFLKPHGPKTKDKCVVFMTTNCQSGGAVHRTAYAEELMKHMDVHSYGRCLHNKDFPKEMQFPIYNDHGASMRNKIFIFKDYKFVLVFENNNVTDYVTEKMPNVLQAGSVPVYMGSHNVHPYWTPGENSIVRTDDFDGPADLAKFLTKACNDDDEYEKFFEWKKKGVSKHFKQRYDDCAFYGAECRLCKYILEQRQNLSKKQIEKVDERRSRGHTYFVASFSGDNSQMTIPSSEYLDIGHTFTISAWIKTDYLDSVILDREGIYTIDLIPHSNNRQAFVRLCTNSQRECFTSSFVINTLNWQHFVVTYRYSEDGTGFVQWWINGMEDPLIEVPALPIDSYPDKTSLIIGADQERRKTGKRFKGEMDDIAIWKVALDKKKAKAAIYDVYAGFEEGISLGDQGTDIVHRVKGQESGVTYAETSTKPLITVHPFL